MLHSLSSTDLPRPPQDIKLISHSMGHVAIATITYDICSLPALNETAKRYFSVMEISLPGSTGQRGPSRLMHLRSPHPAMSVTSVTPIRSTNGEIIYLIVQCASDVSAAPETFLYRRSVKAAEDEEEGERESSEAAVSATGPRVRYQRLPRTIDTAGRVWTATVAVATTESTIPVQPGVALPRPLLIAASGSGLAGKDPRRSTNALQWVEVTSPTRAQVVQTLELPALSTFEVTSLVPVPGSGGRRLLLLCHHAIVEVEAPSPSATGGGVVVSNEAIRRTWKWSPHDRLTSCALKGHTLCAGTEDGLVVLWDLRPGSAAAGAAKQAPAASGGSASSDALAASASCAAATAAVTGLCAPPTTSGFVTCALDGALLAWQHVEDGSAVATTAWQQQQQLRRVRGEDTSLAGNLLMSRREECGNDASISTAMGTTGAGAQRLLRAPGGARSATLALEKDLRHQPAFPYVAVPPGVEVKPEVEPPSIGALPGSSGCVVMAAEGNLLVVGRDLGQLEVYLCG